MRQAPRHASVPTKYKPSAYANSRLPIGYHQIISQPHIVAYLTVTLELRKEQKGHEIGTGSGDQAAVLAEIVDDVYTIEIIEELGEQAKSAGQKSALRKRCGKVW